MVTKKQSRKDQLDKAFTSRGDRWVNEGFGFGTPRDHSSSGYFYPEQLSEQALRALWQGEELAAKIIELPVETMLRGGFSVNIKEPLDNEESLTTKGPEGYEEEEPEESPKKAARPMREDQFPFAEPAPKAPPKPIKGENAETKKQEDALRKQIAELEVLGAVQKALNYARAFGGGGLLLGIDDGQDMAKPVNEAKIKRILYVNALDAFELFPFSWYGDPLAPKYGKVEKYMLSPQAVAGSGTLRSGTLVHESRIIRFEGIVTGARSLVEGAAPGWGDSVLVRINQRLQDLAVSFRAVCVLIRSYGMAFVKVGGLGDLIGNPDFEPALKARIRQIAETGSALNALILTEQDEFGRVTLSFAGLAELLQLLMSLLSAASGIPVNVLFGQGAKGLNNSNEGDIRNFYDHVANQRQALLQPALERLVRLLLLAKEGPTKGQEPPFSVEFAPLWQPSEKEAAEARKIQADTDAIYINAGVVTPEEIAESRFGGAAYSFETRINSEAREALNADYEQAQAEHQERAAEAAEKLAETTGEEAPENAESGNAKPNPFAAANKGS